MNKVILTAALLVFSQTSFAFEATYKTVSSVSVEFFFTSAISAVTSEISSFSAAESRKAESRKILREVDEYNQSGVVTTFLAAKIAIIQSLENSLSIEESVDVLIDIAEVTLAN